ARRQERRFVDGVAELAGEVDERGLAARVDAGDVRLHHGGAAGGVQRGDERARGGGAGGEARGVARAGRDGGLDHVLPGGRLVRLAGRDELRGHDGRAGGGERAEIALVGVPAQDGGGVGDARLR